MSRQYDESIQNKFEYCGEMYSLVDEISSLSDLAEAIHVLDLLRQCENEHEPDSGHPCYWMERQQELVVKEYMDSIGEYDNTQLQNNINFLLRKHNIRVGELEQILGISSGYISRTAKQGSGKKLSIDVVWKIAALFKVSLQDLLQKELDYTETNLEIIERFLSKVCYQTDDHSVEWENGGGCVCEMNDIFAKLPLFDECNEGSARYHPDDHLSTEITWVLADDLYYSRDIVPGNMFVVIHFVNKENEKMGGYDYILFSDDTRTNCRKFFYGCDDRFGYLSNVTDRLMACIIDQENDAILSKDMRAFITDYLK